jgi:Tfp pilus assembly protein FimT
MVVIALLGLMMTIGVGGWLSWARSSGHAGTAEELQSVLRQTQQRAVTEGRAACVLFDVPADAYTIYRGTCDDPGRQRLAGPVPTDASDVQIGSAAFASPTGTSTGVTFYARGTAWPGEVRVTRTGSSKTYVLTVEGLTGRVSLS